MEDRTGNASTMRFVAVVAMINTGIDCAQKALGWMPQELFSNGAIWLWWVAATYWAVVAIVVTYRGAP